MCNKRLKEKKISQFPFLQGTEISFQIEKTRSGLPKLALHYFLDNFLEPNKGIEKKKSITSTDVGNRFGLRIHLEGWKKSKCDAAGCQGSPNDEHKPSESGRLSRFLILMTFLLYIGRRQHRKTTAPRGTEAGCDSVFFFKVILNILYVKKMCQEIYEKCF